MGSNRRYAASVDRRMDARILERTAQEGPLQTLSTSELQLDELAVTTDPKPAVVQAWVRFGKTPIRVEAEACMWTAHVVAIRFRVGTQEYRCWVWRGAVQVPDSPSIS
ncbi:hypothetical protein [uncultured Microbacterium sp.]|uniref:Phenylalanyl-tRNA synthetase beta subunit n=1 Tax=uncultured Microbacterium sp. TaxID=191216 RepID=A0A1Y5NZP1_9MICO|nr:hypothetical protein [uncultured Microbacterium sp.]SBS71835.1 Phenylalanyl-tRNA synthetase beta subunit [uncultured Microbacterium sp.]